MEKIINMEKELTEMTLEELWTLFPIFLVPHDKKWEDNYKEIESVLKEILQKTVRKAQSFRCGMDRIK